MQKMRYFRTIGIILLASIVIWGTAEIVYRWNTEKIELEKTAFAVSSSFSHNVITHVDTGGEKLVALTFDDGPDPRFTPEILDILKKNNIKATFFVVGENCEAYPDIVRRQVAEGHEIENHTFTHPDLNNDDAINTEKQIIRAEKAIEKITHKKPVYFRPPKRLFKNTTLDVAELNGYTTVLWTIGLEHHKSRTVQDMANRVIKAAKPGTIFLAHDGRLDRTRTVEALPLVIQGYKKQGYRFVTLRELMAYQAK
jgi:peptidoglycan/xylan/chitin deacetylase (PgdA/CDA1 family)